MAATEARQTELQKTGEDEHIVKMWTPFNIKVDETYEFIPESRAFIAFSSGMRKFANCVLHGLNKAVFSLEIRGSENLKELEGKGFLTVCNHVNFLDCAMIANAAGRSDITFTTLKENFEIPLVRLLIKMLGAIPIPRTPKAMAKFSEAVGVLLEQGHVVHFYPEGILYPYYNGIRKFKRGAFTYSAKFNKPVVPMLITYYERRGRKPKAVITVLEPVYPDEFLTQKECVRRVESEVREKMERAFENSDCLKENKPPRK